MAYADGTLTYKDAGGNTRSLKIRVSDDATPLFIQPIALIDKDGTYVPIEAGTPNIPFTDPALAVALKGIIAGNASQGASDYGIAIFGKRNGAAPDADNKFGPLIVDTNGLLKVNVAAGAAGGTSLASDVTRVGTEQATPIVAVRKDTAASIATADGKFNVLQMDNLGNLRVMLGIAPQVIGFDAHDTALSTNNRPVLLAAQALALGAVPVDLISASQNVSRLHTDRYGRLWSRSSPPTIKSKTWTFTGAQTNLTLVDPTAGNRVCVTRVAVKVNDDVTVKASVAVGTAPATLPAESSAGEADIIVRGRFAAGGGEVAGNGADDLHIGGSGDLLLYTGDAPTTGKIYLEISFYNMPAT